MVKGFIDNQKILTHPFLIIRSFGILFYLRCISDVLFNKHSSTFLDFVKTFHNQVVSVKVSPETKIP